jgi:hypothetical protein
MRAIYSLARGNPVGGWLNEGRTFRGVKGKYKGQFHLLFGQATKGLD